MPRITLAHRVLAIWHMYCILPRNMDDLRSRRVRAWHAGLLLFLAVFAGCKRTDNQGSSADAHSITFGGYGTSREVYGKAILPAFRRHFRERSGSDITFRESYLGSGAQARAIIGGFEADVAALSLEPEIEQLREAGLITHDWKAGDHGGMVTRSVVVIGVREGNPKNIRSWQDLARPGVEVLTPNVRVSGSAMWNVLAIYGAATRGHAGTPPGDQNAATGLLASILGNVRIMDASGRDSMLTFERGIGDAVITYEHEILVGRAQGRHYDYVTPSSTILIENPVALIDAHVDRHGSRAQAQALMEFLLTPEAQRFYAEYGLRPILESVATEVKGRFSPVENLFTVRDLGGWQEAQRVLFSDGGVYERALSQSRAVRP
jgi:sulfate/thiosulfate transport system substrate-binding protein